MSGTALASENNINLVEHDSSQGDEEEERDNTQPVAEHSTIPSGRAFIFSQADSHGKVHISSAENPETVIYECSTTISLDHSKPKIVITSNGRVIAHVFHHLTSEIRVGVDLSGSGNEVAMYWIEMKRGGFTALNRSFTFGWRNKSYVLTRMRESSHGIASITKRLRHYKVFEKDSGDTVATFLTNAGSGKRTGTLTLHQGVDKDLEVIIMAGVATWREMTRRQRTTGAAVG